MKKMKCPISGHTCPIIKEIDGQTYMSIPEKREHTCDGCVGDVDADLCDALGTDCGNWDVDVIFIKVPNKKKKY
jgi:hypothetical protein